MSDVLRDYVDTLAPRVRGRIKGTAKITIPDHGSVMLDENGAQLGDAIADVTLTASDKVFRAILSGDQNPVTAVMMGKLKVDGNQMRALKVSQILVG